MASHALLQQMAKVNKSHLRVAPIVNGLAPASLPTSVHSQADWRVCGIKHRASILQRTAEVLAAWFNLVDQEEV